MRGKLSAVLVTLALIAGAAAVPVSLAPSASAETVSNCAPDYNISTPIDIFENIEKIKWVGTYDRSSVGAYVFFNVLRDVTGTAKGKIGLESAGIKKYIDGAAFYSDVGEGYAAGTNDSPTAEVKLLKVTPRTAGTHTVRYRAIRYNKNDVCYGTVTFEARANPFPTVTSITGGLKVTNHAQRTIVVAAQGRHDQQRLTVPGGTTRTLKFNKDTLEEIGRNNKRVSWQVYFASHLEWPSYISSGPGYKKGTLIYSDLQRGKSGYVNARVASYFAKYLKAGSSTAAKVTASLSISKRKAKTTVHNRTSRTARVYAKYRKAGAKKYTTKVFTLKKGKMKTLRTPRLALKSSVTVKAKTKKASGKYGKVKTIKKKKAQ